MYKELKREAYEANMDIPKQELAIYTWGNVSAFDKDKGIYAIKPSGVPYDELKAENMVVVDLENKVINGNMRPSSDTKTHTVLYKKFEGIGGVCHTHSTYAVAWAQACKAIPIFGTTHADHLIGNVPITEIMADEAIKNNYEEETGLQIVETFKNLNPTEIEMVLVACHGPFTWGKTAAKSVYNGRVLEEIAKMAMFTLQINPNTSLLKNSLQDKHYQRKHGKNAYYGQK